LKFGDYYSALRYTLSLNLICLRSLVVQLIEKIHYLLRYTIVKKEQKKQYWNTTETVSSSQ